MIDAHRPAGTAPDLTSRELAIEQRHVDRVYAELAKASQRAALVQADGLARARTDRTGEVRDEELTGLFERDALVYTASRRQHTLDQQYEGLVFGRLDLDLPPDQLVLPPDQQTREVRYIGRLGVRDDDYEPLVIDWRAPAAAPFYQATPVQPHGVVRRRVLRCKGSTVVGAEDDLMVPEAPDDLVVLGDGALLAALTRSRHGQMRDIVATIQAHQDQAIRAPARGVTDITGGPGTGKTVVALHRAAFLLYSDRRRYETGGILVVGPSAHYTAYIERVLPSLGEESVVLRALGDILDVASTQRHDPPDVADLKGSMLIRRVLARAARDAVPNGPTDLRIFVDGQAVRLTSTTLSRCRTAVLRSHRRNSSREAMVSALAEAAWAQVGHGDRDHFLATFADHTALDGFLQAWWPPVDPREVLLWLADPARARRYTNGIFSPDQADRLAASMATALEQGSWSVADVALIDDLSVRLGIVPERPREEGFYQVDELDALEAEAISQGHLRGGGPARRSTSPSALTQAGVTPRDRLLHGRIDACAEYAHVLVDEAQDLSPMQWRMLARRGRWASWTVVGDAAQASWPDAREANAAKEEAFGGKPRQSFHMDTNYRNGREIFEYAAQVIRQVMPDADIPAAVRVTGVEPHEASVPADRLAASARESVTQLLGEVEGSVAIIAPAGWSDTLRPLVDLAADRVVLTDPLAAKGLEYDATVVIDPEEIIRDTPGGVRGLYVALTRAAHRMHVLRPE